MMERAVVAPSRVVANGLWNHFTSRKAYTVVCGNCDHSYRDKVPFVTDEASSLCPSCGARNRWSHSWFADWYNQNVARAAQRKSC